MPPTPTTTCRVVPPKRLKKTPLLKTPLLKTQFLKTQLLKTQLLKTSQLLKTQLLKTPLLKAQLLKTPLLKTSPWKDRNRRTCSREVASPCRARPGYRWPWRFVLASRPGRWRGCPSGGGRVLGR